MSAEERAGAPPTGLYIGIGATTLMLGLLGGTLITGWIGGSETVEAPELGASDVDRRVNRLAPAEMIQPPLNRCRTPPPLRLPRRPRPRKQQRRQHRFGTRAAMHGPRNAGYSPLTAR